HREAEPRLRPALLALEPVEDEEARRGRAALPVDGVEVPRPRQAVALVHATEPRPTPTSASGPSRGAASGSRGRRGRTSAHESRADAYAGARWAGKSASRVEGEGEITRKGGVGRAVYRSVRT